MKRLLRLLAALLLCTLVLSGTALSAAPEVRWGSVKAEFESDSLRWKITHCTVGGADCYVTRIWMEDPGTQIGKATADWRTNVMDTADIAARAPEASLIINASGYVTKVYPWIPEDYPGESEDYYYTPLGSVTVTDGQVYRCLTDVPFYGLTLNENGLNMHVGEDPLRVLEGKPLHTWSFYDECPVILDHMSILDPEWKFTRLANGRTIICKLWDQEYLIFTVTRKRTGLTMAQCVDFLMETYDPQWAYNLDGGPSSALMYRRNGKLVRVVENKQANVDIMTFSELVGN